MEGTIRNSKRRPWRFAAAIGLALCGACSRSAYRERADKDAANLVSEKNRDPRWHQDDLNVYPDKRARFYDPFNPDRPPMPADDPTAHGIMRRIDGKHQFKKWHKDGVIDDVQSPCWEMLLPTYTEMTADGKIKLDLKSALLLARLHNPDYQANLEEIYLAALDVAFERFRFDVQFFGGNDNTFATNGNEPSATLGRSTGPAASRESSSTFTNGSTFGFTRRFATGADLLVNFANTFVWQFAGPDTNYATSLLSFNLVQPLLRNGGRAVVLEQLTRAERALLAGLRAQAQYRQQFFKYVAVGGSPSTTPRRIGGFAGGAGLSGFTGTGEGGFGGVGAGQNFGGVTGRGGVGASGAGGSAGFAGGGEGTVGGYYGMLQQLQAIRNTESSLASQTLTLELLEANFEAGLIDLVQVDEFRQNIETERSNLLRSRVAFRDTLENYLIATIGLPPNLEVELDDSATKQFQFIDPRLSAIQTEGAEMLRRLGKLPPKPPIEELRGYRDRLDAMMATGLSEFESVKSEFAGLDAEKEKYLQQIEDIDRRSLFQSNLPSLSASLKNLQNRIADLRKAIAELDHTKFAGHEKETTDRIVELTRTASNLFEEVSLVQARTRVEKVFVKPIKLDDEPALWIARENRLDWMNRRAALVDQWRLITFNANRLKGFLSLNLDGDIGTLKNNGLDFRGKTGNLRASVQFDAPVNRKAERNLYRESLISYQRAKRSYIAFVDTTNLTLRSRLRQIGRLRTNLEIQRRALAISIRRVDQTLEDLNRPAQASKPGEAPPQLGPTLAQNLLRALSDLRNTQDNFMSVWLNYESARINLMIDLGLIRLDDDGMWIDETIDAALARAQAELQQCRPGDSCNQFLDQLDQMTAAGDPRVLEHHDPVEHLLDDADAKDGKLASPLAAAAPGKLPAVQTVPMPTAAGNNSIVEIVDETGKPLGSVFAGSPEGGSSGNPANKVPPSIRRFRKLMEDESQQSPEKTKVKAAEPTKENSEGVIRKVRAWLPTTVQSKPTVTATSKDDFVVQLRQVRKMLDEGRSMEEIRKATGIDANNLKAYVEAAKLTNGAALSFVPVEKIAVTR